MKSRGLTYMLFTIALATWGVIAYKLLSGTNDKHDDLNQNNRQLQANEHKKIEQSLSLTYPDPFLKMINIHYADCINKDTVKIEKNKVKPPSIQYYGIIHKDRFDYYVVMEDSVIHTLKANSTTPNGVQIIKGDTASIQYKNNNHQYSKKIEK